jgi:hypothetical protein
MENLHASYPMGAIRADALAAKGRAKTQRRDTLAKKHTVWHTLFIEVVRRWDAGLAAGQGTKDLKRRLDSPEARNTELDEECDNLSTRRNEQEAMFAEWELSHDQQRRVDCKEEDDRVRASHAADKERWLAESRDQGVRSHDQEVRYLELGAGAVEEAL